MVLVIYDMPLVIAQALCAHEMLTASGDDDHKYDMMALHKRLLLHIMLIRYSPIFVANYFVPTSH